MRKGKGRNGKLLPNSLRIISSCIKTVSTNASTAVRSASASVAASISSVGEDCREQVLWAGFDKLELSPTAFRRILLLGYLKGFQVFDVEDASGLNELVSRRNGAVTFLQMLPAPANCDDAEKYKLPHPILVVVGGDEDESVTLLKNMGQGPVKNGSADSSVGRSFDPPTAVRFYSMKSNEYVKVIEFRSSVLMVRCSPRIVAIGLEEQVYCFDTATLEKKFTVLTYPVPQVGEQGAVGANRGYGPVAVGPRWLAYSPIRPLPLNTGRVSPKSLASSVSPSTSPGNGTVMARYAVESSKQLAAGILTLGDMGYKKLSKLYPDLLPDGANSPGWKIGKLAASEPENAGFVCVKDIVSSEVISHFKAHTSPIAALCFDPSGTLLVTASVHGNNINIFRIMPSHMCSGSGSSDWSTSYVHLYKIYRGITSAVIQDICFSHDSRWIAIVSSKGTCHIFVLSPFGGDDAFKALHANGQVTSLFLSSAPPWWCTPSFTINEKYSSPPPPCNLLVVSRIKCSDSGLLNSVSNVAASVVGKIWLPSGAVAAIFHNSNSTGSLDAHPSSTSLEYILVYTPSGFVVQHEIRSSIGLELSESRTQSLSAPQANPQNEESRVKVEPTQWWDVCRRLDNLEREESLSGRIFNRSNDHEIDVDSKTVSQENMSTGNKKLFKVDSLKSTERSHLYLSNAEVQINSYRLPIWKMSKLQFHVMQPPKADCYLDGEFEIEMTPSHEVEIRQKDLLPIFDHCPRVKSGWINGDIPTNEEGGSSDNCQAKEKTNEASIMCHSKPTSFSSTESSEGGTEKTVDFGLFFKEGYCNKPEINDHHKSTEVATDEVDSGGNNTHEEKPNEEGWIGGVFEFSEEG
ncbi:WD40 repeat protein [Handroanthus impetiginosus]|uniref:WD40 repeat protein n=1 Tax=Handroanthus impetiginosus TaxID=429701 RepID=A0A2G9H7C3_9LAMI|nr:WD40 repeat protein [Handroanthus impetiginosus]